MSTDSRNPLAHLHQRMATLPQTATTPRRQPSTPSTPAMPTAVTPTPVITPQPPAQTAPVPTPPASPQPLPYQPQPIAQQSPPQPVMQPPVVQPALPAIGSQPVPVFPGTSPYPTSLHPAASPSHTARRHPPPQAANLPPMPLQAQYHPQHPVPFQQLMQDILNRNLLPGQKFCLVVVPDDSGPQLLHFDRVEDLINEVRVYLDTNTSLFPFLGYPLQISGAPHRYLRTPFGLMPLFVMPREDELVFADNGFVGLPEPPLPPPAPAPVVDADGEETADDAHEPPVDPRELVDAPLYDNDSPVAPLGDAAG